MTSPLTAPDSRARAGAGLSGQRLRIMFVVAATLLSANSPGGAAAGAESAAERSAALAAGNAASAATAAASRVETDHLVARLIAEHDHVVPGGSVDLALVFDIQPGWHTYWRNPGDSGEPPRIEWLLPDGLRASPIRWPYPDLIRVGPLANYGYSGRVAHLIRLSVAEDWPAGRPIELRADASWLVCEEHCIPEEGRFALTLETEAEERPEQESSVGEGRRDNPARGSLRDRDARIGPAERERLFAEARGAMPAAGRIAVDLESQQQAMRLRVPAAPLPPEPTSVAFFADHWGFIEHAAPQHWELAGDGLVMTLTPGAASASTAPTGLLVVDSADGTRALRVDAMDSAARQLPSAQRHPSAADASSGSTADTLALPTALLFALIGGMVLNLMPCVFPVLAIKALALAQQGETALQHRALHGAAYTAGVLLLFAGVALLLLALRAGGASLGWGFQLQSPVFVVLMAYLFLTLGLSLAGAVTLGAGLMGIGRIGASPVRASPMGAGAIGIGRAGPQHHYLGAFVTGALAALVAAPCTAPFMGAAVGYAVAQPWPVALAVIMTLGLGMALPFAALALSPALARRLPRPGRWMEYLKQFLAFPMFGTAAWLLWVLAQQTGPTGVGAALAGAVLLALALWLLEVTRAATGRWRRVGNGGALVSTLAALWLAVGLAPNPASPPRNADSSMQRAASGAIAEAFSAQRLADARASGQPVFVNMTAAWCITCLVNERVALARPAVVAAFDEHDVLYLKGDWTNRDAAITEYLAAYGRNGVPLYVYYPPSAEPIVLPQVLSESAVLDILR